MITKVSTADMKPGSPEWLDLRKTTVGGSEASSVVGMNPYQSSFALWAEKTGRAKPFEGNLSTEVGQWMEEFCAKKFQEISGLRVQRSNFIYFNDDYPNQHALPDRLCYQKDGEILAGYQMGLEIKTTSAFHKLKENQFPEMYYCQCVQYMAVMNFDVWFLFVLVGNSEYHIYELRRNDDIHVPQFVEGVLTVNEDEFKALRDACNDFMQMVKDDTAPIADGSESSAEAIGYIYPTAEEGTVAELKCSDTIQDYLRLKENISALTKEKDALENIIKQEMAENETGVCGDYKVTWKNSSRTTFDSKRFREDSPDLYGRYIKTTNSRTLSVKGDKK